MALPLTELVMSPVIVATPLKISPTDDVRSLPMARLAPDATVKVRLAVPNTNSPPDNVIAPSSTVMLATVCEPLTTMAEAPVTPVPAEKNALSPAVHADVAMFPAALPHWASLAPHVPFAVVPAAPPAVLPFTSQ